MTGDHKDKTLTRRRALAVTGGTVAAGGLAVAGYRTAFADTTASAAAPTSAAASTSASDTASAPTSSSSGSRMSLMPSVTEGPYHLDGALVRKNITEGKSGVPLTLRLTVVDATDGCTPVAGAAVEIWRDAWGYCSGCTTANPGGSAPAESEDGSAANDSTYLRGHRIANANGVVKFETIFPGWYSPRTCHIHVKVHSGGQRPVKKADPARGCKGFLTLGVDPDAENTGAGGGGAGGAGGTPPTGTPPSGTPTGTPPSGAPSTSASS
ncbi:protocatechuate dioxygenase [Streptomyces sp. NPDC088254]|uniref:protocatechuate dioxygenase n=1 Tax=Streptomyces sp. NPDC088254 TaxID=3365847 RepID=UPI00380269B5